MCIRDSNKILLLYLNVTILFLESPPAVPGTPAVPPGPPVVPKGPDGKPEGNKDPEGNPTPPDTGKKFSFLRNF